VPDFGSTGRGSDMQIGTYVEKFFATELSGNVIDLCPVGALTSKPYSFIARPWETRKTESVDVMDALGPNIVISHRTGEILRILPKMNDDINEEWISDKTRFALDGLKRQRLLTPMLRVNGNLTPSSWEEALFTVATKLRQASPSSAIAAVAGSMNDAESLVALKDLLNRFNSEHVYSDGEFPSSISGGIDLRSNYLLNDKLISVDSCDVLLLIGTNPRYEAPLFNSRIRKAFLHSDIEIGVVGSYVDLTYDYQYLGSTMKAVDELLSGQSAFSEKLSHAKNPVIVIGVSALEGKNGAGVLAKVQQLAQKVQSNGSKSTKIVNILHRSAGQVAAFDIGYRPFNDYTSEAKRQTKFLYLLGADDQPISREQFAGNVFVVYQGHHGDVGAEMADVVLPGAAYTEKEATWVNTEGRAQRGYPAVAPPGDGRVDWKIIRALSEVAGKTLHYDTIQEIRSRMAEVTPHLVRYGDAEEANYFRQAASLNKELPQTSPDASLEARQRELADFWMTNSIARASQTMAECVRASKLYKNHAHLDPLAVHLPPHEERRAIA